MGKDGFLTPKAIANRIKAKGLQKLKFYCQMCDKQCRDANGFKCHKESEGHQRMMLLFAESSEKYISDFSDQFLTGYLDLLKHRFGTKLVKANTVYQEYIKDRQHVHMNSTKWATLSEFAAWLGRQGLCHVEEKEDGWHISYVDQEAAERAKKAAEIEEKRIRELESQEKHVERLMKKARKETKDEKLEVKEFVRDDNSKVGMEIKKSGAVQITMKNSKPPSVNPFGLQESENGNNHTTAKTPKKSGMSALEQIKLEGERKAAQKSRKDYWLYVGIAVKIINKEVGGGKYYKCKGEVVEVIDKYAGVVKLFDFNAKLKLDQNDLETVIPKPGGSILILNGVNRGERGIVESIEVEQYCATIRLTTGPDKDKMVRSIDYQDISKLVSHD